MLFTTEDTAPLLLVILDGLALNPNPLANAVLEANTPTLDRLLAQYPTTTLVTHGTRVGLPEGQMGNSEVGHLNIGAGRVVEQELSRIDRVIAAGNLDALPELQHLITDLKQRPYSALHLIGLISPGGVHSQQQHVLGIIQVALSEGLQKIVVHAITDGRDRPPTSAKDELVDFERQLKSLCNGYPQAKVGIGTVIGRYYAMDRDKRWERTKSAYDLYTLGKGSVAQTVKTAIDAELAAGRTDEFFQPCIIGNPLFSDRSQQIENGDGLLFFNFRADRMRQIVSAFLPNSDALTSIGQNNHKTIDLCGITTLTEYDKSYPVNVVFRPQTIANHLGQVLAKNSLRQTRAAETEKYPHVTYFFNGGVEQPLTGEQRILVPSPRDVATYDLKPEMSAVELTDKVVAAIRGKSSDVYILNYANCDMVGHTGSLPATIRAVETVDACLNLVLAEILALGGTAIVTADHGNADQMLNYQTGEPHTFHTLHPVPCILVSNKLAKLRLRDGGALCDLAPTICQLLGIAQPQEMTGESLIALPSN